MPDKVSSKAIAATKSKITYKFASDGSIVLRSLKGISQESFKRLSDKELEAIGLFREQKIGGDKYFKIRDEGRDRKVKETKAITAKRFTVQDAIAYVTKKTGKPLGEKSFTQNAKKYGFAIKERGSGVYALIEP